MTTWLERNDPGVFATLGGPGSQEAIDRAELRMGLELPAQVRQWLLANDVDADERTDRQDSLVRRGCDVPVPGGHILLGLEDIQRVYLWQSAMERAEPSEDPDCPLWRPEWLPIAAERDGLYGTFLDTANGTIGTWAEVYMPEEGVFASLPAFFHRAADLLEGVSTGDWSGPGAPARSLKRDEPRPEDEAIRRWADAHGMVVNDRGRIPSYVRDAYLEVTT
ncbi:histone-like nucleoid-structuring protein Lsr2 [Kitasatospora sp. NPDC101157]|uniref:Lsr2 family DNA-binding protein n=1 Tax=Kitasatospora sp. NPDC101157 TaxID=3364098 RepID=UPI00381A79CF